MQETQSKLTDVVLQATEGRMAITEMHNRIQDALLKEDKGSEQVEKLKEQIKILRNLDGTQKQMLTAMKERPRALPAVLS